jgi:CMP-N-acetylneuraminic acid synthetase
MKSLAILGIILARGGSKRVPRKNIAPLNGKPLLAYTCEAALGSKLLTRTILSTDDGEIAATGRACGIEVPFLRPQELALDTTDSLPVVLHVLSELEKREHYAPVIVVLLQPTSPLRTSAHIDEGIALLQQTGADSVVSVTEVPHYFEPAMVMRIVDEKLSPVPAPRERTGVFYALNGAVYALNTKTLLRTQSLFGSDCRPLVMDWEHSLDIDTEADLALAEFLLNRPRKKP